MHIDLSVTIRRFGHDPSSVQSDLQLKTMEILLTSKSKQTQQQTLSLASRANSHLVQAKVVLRDVMSL